MVCLGGHLAIADGDRARLLATNGDNARAEFVREVLEENWDQNFGTGTEKAWDAIHRCMTGQPANMETLDSTAGSFPLNRLILGGMNLTSDDYIDYIIHLVDKSEVPDVARAIEPITEKWMRDAYHKHCKGAWPMYGEDDCKYTWVMFEPLKLFFLRAAEHERHVLFSADQ